MSGNIETINREEYVKDPRSGKWVKNKRHIVVNPQDLSIDELLPPGVEGPLLKTPPQKLGGVTSAQVEKSRLSHPQAGIEQSLPTQDKD